MINKISKIKLKPGKVLVSFDVVSLFTNVPIDETIKILRQRFFKATHDLLQGSHFMFNEKLYQQVDVMSMGSNLGTPMSHLWMNHFETTHVAK